MKVSPSAPKSVVYAKTTASKDAKAQQSQFKWWKAPSAAERGQQMLSTASYLKTSQDYRFRMAAMYARLYGNMSLFSFIGTNISKMDQNMGMPADKPTFNVIQSATDTLVSRISQSRPAPVFLTDNGDYKNRNLAKKLNNFILGEFYQAKAYEKGEFILRDAIVEGTGCIKVFEGTDDKVALERVLLTELFTDPNESIYGEPRQLFQVKLVDRSVLMDMFPDCKFLAEAQRAYIDGSAQANQTISDQVMVVEGWHLKSGKDAKDGRHTIACSSGTMIDDPWNKDKFPFVFLHYSKRLLGFWSQGLAEQLMGTQLEINTLLHTISKAIKLVGVPRVFQEDGAKVVSAHHNNDIGVIVKYRGTKPSYEVAPCNAPELYAERDKLIQYAYQQCGVSSLQATSQKPQGLDSGEAIRSYDDISSDRFASLSRRYDNVFIDLAYLMIDTAMDIAKRIGEYSTVYPNKNGTKQIDLPKIKMLEDPFIIQCFNMSSLPRDPAGRMAKVTEMIQSGMISIKEGRRLLDYPDLEQVEKLANASEERIYQILDEIVEDGKYTPPDPFMDLILANDTVVQYYNLYSSAKLEEDKAQMLRDFFDQVQDLKTAAMPPSPAAPQPTPQANAMPLPQSPLVPNAVA